jgi:L,D-transpeptidase YcbB
MRTVKILFCALLVAVAPQAAPAGRPFLTQVAQLLEQQVEVQIGRAGFVCRREPICSRQILPFFYQNRGFAPVWFGHNGLKPAVLPLMQSIRQAGREGLKPADYHLTALEQMLAKLSAQPFPPDESQARLWADFDLVMTDAFLLLASHLSGGRINPETLQADWLINERSIDMLTFLNTAATAEQMEAVIARLQPAHRGYTGLKAALQHMREIERQGGWPQVEGGQSLNPGDTDDRIAVIRRRLRISGDLPAALPEPAAPRVYDADLAAAASHFQRRHGLEPDGVIGPRTREAMNVTAARRARQIELNLERWRWLPQQLGERYIAVNIADFRLQVVDNQQIVLDMRVVVGRPARRTPVFSTTMSYLVLDPYWTVPRTIAVEDILPKLTGGVGYLVEHNIKVFAGWQEDAPELDPLAVPWQTYNDAHFPVMLRQEPGRNNALGQIKFIFPNKFAVYLHDTPQRALFERVQRDFSSGCIRVEKARALAAYLLCDDPNWTPEKLKFALAQGDRRLVRIPRPIAVHLLYMTAWVDENDTLQFRRDIYDRDCDLDAALLTRNPYPLPTGDMP